MLANRISKLDSLRATYISVTQQLSLVEEYLMYIFIHYLNMNQYGQSRLTLGQWCEQLEMTLYDCKTKDFIHL